MLSISRSSSEQRAEVLRNLLTVTPDLRASIGAARALRWDYDYELVRLHASHIRHVLRLYLSGEFSSTDVEDWANAVESREDVGLDEARKDDLASAIFDLANPALQGALTPDSADRLNQFLASPPPPVG
jgi:hypothetical protein